MIIMLLFDAALIQYAQGIPQFGKARYLPEQKELLIDFCRETSFSININMAEITYPYSHPDTGEGVAQKDAPYLAMCFDCGEDQALLRNLVIYFATRLGSWELENFDDHAKTGSAMFTQLSKDKHYRMIVVHPEKELREVTQPLGRNLSTWKEHCLKIKALLANKPILRVALPGSDLSHICQLSETKRTVLLRLLSGPLGPSHWKDRNEPRLVDKWENLILIWESAKTP